MKSWNEVVLSSNSTIREAIIKIDHSTLQVALVASTEGRLLGTVTDGDIRRGILRGVSLEDPVNVVMNRNPKVAGVGEDRDSVLMLMKQHRLHQVPIVDSEGTLLGLECLDELLNPRQRDNPVILMAGGTGSRLRPLTEEVPKPMLKVGNRPILETILINFAEYGFRNFHFAVNYKAKVIEEYFGNGEQWNVQINYIQENKRLGTAGALSLLSEPPSSPILVMNADLLTKVNFAQLLAFHHAHKAVGTMCVREYDVQVPFGVLRLDSHKIVDIEEKPVQKFFVNAGVYVLEPDVLQFVPKDEFFDMPQLFETLIGKKKEVCAFPIREYWLDIGRHGDYERANNEFTGYFE